MVKWIYPLTRVVIFFCVKTVDIIIPELNHMRVAHVVTFGSESASALSPEFEDG